MKTSIAFTLIIVATIFSFVSGYSIGSHSDQAAGYNMTRQAGDSGGSIATARAAENPPEAAAPTGGYGSQGGASTAASPGYGAPAPAPGYGK